MRTLAIDVTMRKGVFDWMAAKWVTSYRINRLRTSAYSFLRPSRTTKVIFVLGCQRSGTTMLANLLGLSPLVRLYGEGDPKYFREDGTRQLRPRERVLQLLGRERSPFTLIKPLCDSQRARELLDEVPNSKAVWIFRHYRDCVLSHVNYYRTFHDGIEYVQDLLRPDRSSWKNQHLEEETLRYLRLFRDRPMNVATAYALYWLARNSLMLSVADDQRVMPVNFERIVKRPSDEARRVFAFLKVPFDQAFIRIVREPRSAATEAPIDQDVVERCEEMYKRLLNRVVSDRVRASHDGHVS